jgi:type IV secretory pathway VirB3-like protein
VIIIIIMIIIIIIIIMGDPLSLLLLPSLHLFWRLGEAASRH